MTYDLNPINFLNLDFRISSILSHALTPRHLLTLRHFLWTSQTSSGKLIFNFSTSYFTKRRNKNQRLKKINFLKLCKTKEKVETCTK